MNDPSVEQAFKSAVALQQSGRLQEAEAKYRELLSANPNHAPALHMLGTLASRSGYLAQAVELIKRAISVSPNVAEFHSDLGIALFSLGRSDEAIEAFRAAIAADSQHGESWNNLATALMAIGRATEGLEAYRETVKLTPNNAPAYANLAGALEQAGELNEALEAARKAIALDAILPAAHYNLANILMRLGRSADAAAAYRASIALRPEHAQAWTNLTVALVESGELDEAVAAGQSAVRLNPNHPSAYQNLGAALMEQGRLSEAIETYRRALAVAPSSQVHSNLLFLANFQADQTPQSIRNAHVAWAAQIADPLTMNASPHDNDRDPNRRLRIGYVSADFREHSVGRFMKPIMANHDHTKFEIFCYSNGSRSDVFAEQFKTLADHWRETRAFSDEQLADKIRADKIDILVDLSLHMSGNRLLVFARKPAPVQATYLAYAGTSGMRAMDYRLTDPFLDDDAALPNYTEQSIRLASYWCYEPEPAAPDVGPLPDGITFGCLNSFFKASDAAMRAWAKILLNVPDSRLILHTTEGSHRERARELFVGCGVANDRIEFVKQQPLPSYLATYNRIHIALDPFPYCGGTTSCDALWMGVPLITLAGNTAVARAGVSLLNQIKLTELIARDIDRYVELATTLALDRPRLQNLRETMRDRMRASPLMNVPNFMHDLENAYRLMWRKYCSL